MPKKSQEIKRYLVHPSIAKNLEFDKLRKQGHIVDVMEESHDMILGPNCWRITLELLPWLKDAIKASKSVVVRRSKKEVVINDDEDDD